MKANASGADASRFLDETSDMISKLSKIYLSQISTDLNDLSDKNESLFSETSDQHGVLSPLNLKKEPKCLCEMTTDQSATQSTQQSCVLKIKGSSWPEQLLIHPLIEKYISVPEFEVTCDPLCKCSADQIKMVSNFANSDRPTQIKDNKILVNGPDMGQETAELLLTAQMPDGQQYLVQQMKVSFVDSSCPIHLFQDFYGEFIDFKEQFKKVLIPLNNPDSKISKCGLPQFKSNDSCLILENQVDQLVVSLNKSVCNQTGVRDSQLEVYFDQYQQGTSIINFQYQILCIPSPKITGSGNQNFYYNQSHFDQGNSLSVNLGFWEADSQCSTPFTSQVQLPPGQQLWYNYDQMSQEVHVFRYPDDPNNSKVTFELQASIGSAVIKSQVITLHFQRNFEPKKRRLQAFLDNQSINTQLLVSVDYSCKKISDGSDCVNPRIESCPHCGPSPKIYDNDAYVIYQLKSDDLDTLWAITETWNEAITVKTVIGEQFDCFPDLPCRVYVGNNTNYLSNPQCGSNNFVNDGFIYECNLQGYYVTYLMHSDPNYYVSVDEMRHWPIQRIPATAVSSETTNCDISSNDLIKFEAQSVLELTCCNKYYDWNGITNCAGTYPELILNLNSPYLIQEVYIIKNLDRLNPIIPSPVTTSTNLLVIIDGQLCGILADKNTALSFFPIQRLKCNVPLVGSKIIIRSTTLQLDEIWIKFAIFGTQASPCQFGNSILMQNLVDIQIDEYSLPTIIAAPQDLISGSSKPPTCGDRTCTSDHQNVIWNQTNQNWMVITKQSADVVGTYKVNLKCSLTDYPDVPAITQSFTLTIKKFQCTQNQTVSAKINELNIKKLPELLVNQNYSIVSQQDFNAVVNSTILSIFSSNYYENQILIIDLISQNVTLCTFQVLVNFKVPKGSYDVERNKNNQIVLRQSKNFEFGFQIPTITESVICMSEKSKCPIKCQDQLTGEVFRLKCSKNTKNQHPILEFSKISLEGILVLKFSEPMNTVNIKYNKSSEFERQITQKVEWISNKKYQRLLKPIVDIQKLINITMKSENKTDRGFTWEAIYINSTQIFIQIYFDKPPVISSDDGGLDKLNFELLPPSLNYFYSLKTGLFIADPLQTTNRICPPQVILSEGQKIVKTTAQSIEYAGQAIIIVTLIAQIVLTGKLTRLWTMENALNIMISFQQINLCYPGNVTLVFTYITNLVKFLVVPAGDWIDQMFTFSETKSPFECIDGSSMRLIPYLGMTLFILLTVTMIYLVYGLIFLLEKKCKSLKKIKRWLHDQLFYNLIIRFCIQSYLIFAIGSLLSVSDLTWKSVSDKIDMVLTILGLAFVVGFPIFTYFFMTKNLPQFRFIKIQKQFKALYEGYQSQNLKQRSKSILQLTWFFVRRALTAVNLVFLRNEQIMIQIAVNINLCLADACIKLNWFSFEDEIQRYIEPCNDFLLLFMSNIILHFTDFTPSEDQKYTYGWIYSSVAGFLTVLNCGIMIFSTLTLMVIRIKKKVVLAKYRKKIKIHPKSPKKNANQNGQINLQQLDSTLNKKPSQEGKEKLQIENRHQIEEEEKENKGNLEHEKSYSSSSLASSSSYESRQIQLSQIHEKSEEISSEKDMMSACEQSRVDANESVFEKRQSVISKHRSQKSSILSPKNKQQSPIKDQQVASSRIPQLMKQDLKHRNIIQRHMDSVQSFYNQDSRTHKDEMQQERMQNQLGLLKKKAKRKLYPVFTEIQQIRKQYDWFTTPQQYDAKYEILPDIRYPIEHVPEYLKREIDEQIQLVAQAQELRDKRKQDFEEFSNLRNWQAYLRR